MRIKEPNKEIFTSSVHQLKIKIRSFQAAAHKLHFTS